MFLDINEYTEPSAGCGNISEYIKEKNKNILSYDIVPENKYITQIDYLKTKINYSNYITIGNPPIWS